MMGKISSVIRVEVKQLNESILVFDRLRGKRRGDRWFTVCLFSQHGNILQKLSKMCKGEIGLV